MSVATWSLPNDASLLDRATLRVMQRWHGGLRDAGRAMAVVAVVLAASEGSGGLIHSGSGLIGSITGGLVGIALPAGWLVHRKRHPVALPVRVGARLIGGFLGVLLAIVLRGRSS